MIVADIREDQKIIEMLKKNGVEVSVDALPIGDYLINNETVVERKEKDFLSSIFSKRIWEQLNQLKQYKNPILVIISNNIYKDVYYSKHPNPIDVYISTITTIISSYNIPVVILPSKEEFVKFLKYLDKEKGDSSRPVSKPRKDASMNEIVENILAQIPGISIKKAQLLLKSFGNIKSIINADEKSLNKVRDIGSNAAKNIKMVFEYIWEEENGKRNGKDRTDKK